MGSLFCFRSRRGVPESVTDGTHLPARQDLLARRKPPGQATAKEPPHHRPPRSRTASEFSRPLDAPRSTQEALALYDDHSRARRSPKSHSSAFGALRQALKDLQTESPDQLRPGHVEAYLAGLTPEFGVPVRRASWTLRHLPLARQAPPAARRQPAASRPGRMRGRWLPRPRACVNPTASSWGRLSDRWGRGCVVNSSGGR